jgi:hypothetical protein
MFLFIQFTQCWKIPPTNSGIQTWIIIYKIEIVDVRSVVARERINQFTPNLAWLFLETIIINGATAQSRALASLTGFATVRYITMWVISPTINLVLVILIHLPETSSGEATIDSLRPRRDFRKVKTPKMSWVRVPVRAVPVARKLSTIEERHQEPKLVVSKRRSQKRRQNP